MKTIKKQLSLFIISFIFVGCASVPKEAPQLSIELGKKIASIEESHLILLDRFFDQKREEIDKFIQNEWIPIFAKKVFSDKTVEKYWKQIVQSNNKEDRLMFLIKMGLKLQNKINTKRLELIKPLDALQNQIEQQIRLEYTKAKSINNSLTSFLVSASQVDENRQRYLDMIGLSDDKISNILDTTDSVVSGLLQKSENVQEIIGKGESYLKKINELKEKINTTIKDK